MTPERYQKLRAVLDRRQPDLTVLMENVHKPHNLSAVMRTCDAVGVIELHTVNKVAPLPNFNQVALGSEKWVNLQPHADIQTAVTHLKNQKLKIYAAHLSERSQDYRTLDYTQPTAILLGAEKWGVSPATAASVDGHLIIPMMGMVQSLNVSVAAAVILFEAQRQRREAGLYEQVRLNTETYSQMLFEWGYPALAAMCQQEGKPYPALGADGEILSD